MDVESRRSCFLFCALPYWQADRSMLQTISLVRPRLQSSAIACGSSALLLIQMSWACRFITMAWDTQLSGLPQPRSSWMAMQTFTRHLARTTSPECVGEALAFFTLWRDFGTA